ncbi:hypothetical protein [Agave vitivirus A]|nr:hypothetical protein [Agave vitivirus A]
MERVARLYKVRELVDIHNNYVLGFSDFPLILEVCVRSVVFTAITEIVPTFLAWHTRNGRQSYTHFLIGTNTEITSREFSPNGVIDLLVFSDVSTRNLTDLVSFVGSTNIRLVAYSNGHLKNRRRQQVRLDLTMQSLDHAIGRLNGLIVLLS